MYTILFGFIIKCSALPYAENVDLFQSFVGCSLGIAYVGYAMTSLRFLLVAASHVSARLLHCLHRRYLIAFCMLLELGIIASWFLVPDYEGVASLIACCALIGCVFGIFRTVYYGRLATFTLGNI